MCGKERMSENKKTRQTETTCRVAESFLFSQATEAPLSRKHGKKPMPKDEKEMYKAAQCMPAIYGITDMNRAAPCSKNMVLPHIIYSIKIAKTL